MGCNGTLLVRVLTPYSDRFASNDNSALSQQIFNISVAQIEAIIKPDSVGDNIWRESVAFIGIHRLILAIMET